MKGITAVLLVFACLLLTGCVSRSGLFARPQDNASYVLCAAAGQPVATEDGSALKENDLSITQPCNPGI